MMNRRQLLHLTTGPALSLLLGHGPRSASADEAGERLRAGFLKSFERPRVPLAPEAGIRETKNGLLHEKVTISSETSSRVPVLVVGKAEEASPKPVVIVLHGLGGRKEGLASYLEEFARRGFVGVALDARYHGDRAGDVQAAMVESFKTGKEHPYLWDTCWDTWRVMDYLQMRPDVDRDRIGVMGISLGGHTTWMVSADPRVKAAVPCISVCSWRWQLERQGYVQRVKNLSRAFEGAAAAMGEKDVTPKVVAEAWNRWIPGVPAKYDCQDLLAAYAPRPLLIVNGDSDPVAPLEGVKVAVESIETGYRRAGASDRLKVSIAEKSGHTITTDQQALIYQWFERWLGVP